MKNIYYLLLTLAISSLSFGQGSIDFDTASNWTASMSGYGDYEYTDTNFLAVGTEIMKNGTSSQDGFPGALGTSSVRLKNSSTSSLTMSVTSGGIADFTFQVRRWDASPDTNFSVETTTDGSTWSLSSTIDVNLTDDSDWKTVSGTVNSANTTVGVRIVSNGTNERIMVDNFTWTAFQASDPPLQITTSVCATATSVRLTGPWWGWDPTGGPEAVSNNDGTWTFTFDPAPTENMEYLLVVDGVQENLISIMANGGTCAPVTDGASYANRQWILDSGDVTNNYGQCGTTCVAPVITLLGGDETITVGDTYTDAGATASDDEQGDITGDILGITDLDTSVAGEYTVAYNVSDGALNAATEVVRTVTVEAAGPAPLQITTSVCATATSVRLTGPWWGWDPTGGPEAVSNNDGTWTFTFDPAPTENMEYLLVVDGVQENLISIMANGGTCAPVTDGASYANRQWILDSGDVTNNYGQCGTTCVAPVITLLGGDETITVGDTYTDAGATASDDEQGDITGDILGITDLDTSVAGEYTVAYNVSDGALNAATEVVRTVTVEEANVTSFPYCSSFDTDLGDWSTEVTQGTSNWESASSSNSSVAAYSGGGSAYYYSGNYNGDSSVLISRPMDITALASPQVTFQIANPSWGTDQDVLEVWYKATAADAWSVLGTYSDATTTFSEVTLNLPNASNDYYIAFNATSGYGYGVLIDDVCIAEGPSCLDPTDLTVADITQTTASVSWTANSGESAWEYQVVAGGATPAETGEETPSNPLALTGLTANTLYDVYVRANCGDSVSGWVMESFTTPLATQTSFPYCSSFDTDLGDWSTEVTQGTSNWESASSSNSSVAAYSGGGSAYYYSGNYNGDSSVLISRPMDITALASPQVTFQIANPSWGTDQDVLEVWYKATAADAWSVLGTYSDATTTFSEVTLNLPNASNDYYIAFNATSGYGYGVLIDDVCIAEGPSCLDPTDLAVSDITTTTASVSWTANSGESAWEYQVVESGVAPNATGEETPSNPLALTELTANTTYDVYVRANCGTDGTSEWVMVSFTTPCVSYSIPYFEGFESGYTHASSVGGCLSQESITGTGTWAANNTLTSFNRTPRTGDWNAYVGYSNEDWLFISVDLTADMSYTASVHARQDGSTASNSDITISYGASASAAAMTNTIVPATGIVNGDYQLISGAFTPTTSGTHVIGIKGYMNGFPYYISIDDISIDLSPDCLMPTDLAVSDITTTTASVSWTANSGESAWEYQVVESGVAPNATGEETPSNPLALTELTANTTYDVYVRANCGTDGTSEWGMVSFTTLPDPIVPNYTNDFATFPGDLWSQAEGAIADGPSGSTSLWDTGNFAHGTNAPAAYINIFSTNRNEWLISPSFDLIGMNYYLNVDVAATEYLASWSTDDPVDAIWGVDDFVTLMVSEDGGSTWNELYRWDANNNPGVAGAAMPEIDLSAYTGLAKFAFYAESTVTNEDIDFFVDNFSITSTSLGLEDVNTTSNFTYFPNPVNNVLSIKAQASIDSITVYNMLGQTVVRSTPNTTTTAVDMSGLQTGAYFVQVAINNSIETVRVIKN